MRTILCVVCGKEFEPYRGRRNAKFCSKKCRNRVDKNARRFSGLRDYILERDDLKCVECGATKALTVHHKDADCFNNVPDNLITLCRSCHASHHMKDNFGLKLDSKKCVTCGNEFYPLRNSHVLCRRKECRAEWKKVQKRAEHEAANCVICNKQFVQKHSNHNCCSPECRRVYDLEQKQLRYENNKPECLDRQKRYYAGNKEKVKSYVKKWQQENPGKRKAYYQKQKLQGKFRVNHQEKECLICGTSFKPKTKRSLCCSEDCLYQNKIRKNREARHLNKNDSV